MQKTALSFVACLLVIAAAGAHASSLWKWRDASGQLHISDTPPPAGTPAANILSTPSVSAAPAPAPSSSPAAASAPAAAPAVSALDKKKKAAEQEKADKEKAQHDAVDAQNAAIRKDNCARAQSSLANLKSGQRIAVVNGKGEREIMDDAARAEETRHARDVVASDCNPMPSHAN